MTAGKQPATQSTSSNRKNIHKSKLLIVEGKEDRLVFKELCDHWGLEDIQIVEMEGIENLRARLEVLVRDPGFRSLRTLGITRDADKNAQNAFQSVRNVLTDFPQFRTKLPSRAGVRNRGHPATAVFIVPDNESPGNLETMLNRTKSGDSISICIEEYFNCLSQQTGFSLSGSRLDKARAHARVAASSNPARSVGHSVRASGVWDLDHESLTPFRTFLSKL
ncbi:MAG: hypothetical protein OXI96_09065 [Acidimicrobiaceae bacterium]|nr:hypothetical protein [Acidimicrobiaceae bacterium]